MKKIFLMGRSEAGKTSLTQALKGEELHYVKTQYTKQKMTRSTLRESMQSLSILVLDLPVFHLKQT